MAQSWGASNIGSVNQLECHKCTASVVYRLSKILFSTNPSSPQKTLGLWILWIHDPFLDLPKKNYRKIRFWIRKFGFGFSQKNAPLVETVQLSTDKQTEALCTNYAIAYQLILMPAS